MTGYNSLIRLGDSGLAAAISGLVDAAGFRAPRPGWVAEKEKGDVQGRIDCRRRLTAEATPAGLPIQTHRKPAS